MELLEGTITIPKEEFLELRIAQEKLNMLERGGVDNWEWYDESLYPENKPDLDEWRKKEKERIKNL